MAPPCPLFPSLSGVRLSQNRLRMIKAASRIHRPGGHLGYSADRSRVTGNPHLTLVSVGCCSRARVCLDRRSKTQIFVHPAAFTFTSVQGATYQP